MDRTRGLLLGGLFAVATVVTVAACSSAPGSTSSLTQPTTATGGAAGPTPTVNVSPSAAPPAPPSPSPTIGSSPQAAASEAALAAPSPGTIAVHGKSQTFSSNRYGYSVTIPASWLVTEIPGKWNGIAKGVGEQDAGTDRFSSPGVIAIEVGFQAQADGTSIAAWESSEAAWVREGDCTEASSTEAIKVAGRDVLLLGETCPSQVIGENPGNQSFLNAFLVNGGTGVLIQMNSRKGHEAADRATFLQILGTLKLGPS